MEVKIFYRANGDEWTLNSKSESVYDNFGNLVLQNFYFFDPLTRSLKIHTKFEGEAIAKFKYTNQLTSYFNPETQVLESLSERIDEYDDKFRTIQSLHYGWNSNTQQRVGYIRWDYLRNINVNGKSLNIDETYKWDDAVSDWVIEQKRFHYHKSIISTVDEKNKNLDLILYPNPVGNELTIKSENEKLKELRLYSSSGSLVQVVSDINATVFKLPFTFSEGYYFLKVSTDSTVETYNVIK